MRNNNAIDELTKYRVKVLYAFDIMTQTEIAHWFGITQQAVSAIVKEGITFRRGSKMFKKEKNK